MNNNSVYTDEEAIIYFTCYTIFSRLKDNTKAVRFSSLITEWMTKKWSNKKPTIDIALFLAHIDPYGPGRYNISLCEHMRENVMTKEELYKLMKKPIFKELELSSLDGECKTYIRNLIVIRANGIRTLMTFRDIRYTSYELFLSQYPLMVQKAILLYSDNPHEVAIMCTDMCTSVVMLNNKSIVPIGDVIKMAILYDQNDPQVIILREKFYREIALVKALVKK